MGSLSMRNSEIFTHLSVSRVSLVRDSNWEKSHMKCNKMKNFLIITHTTHLSTCIRKTKLLSMMIEKSNRPRVKKKSWREWRIKDDKEAHKWKRTKIRWREFSRCQSTSSSNTNLLRNRKEEENLKEYNKCNIRSFRNRMKIFKKKSKNFYSITTMARLFNRSIQWWVNRRVIAAITKDASLRKHF